MELTKKDKKHIEDMVKRVDIRMKQEATEYAKLCELYYYEKMRERIDIQLQVLREYPDMIRKFYNNDNPY